MLITIKEWNSGQDRKSRLKAEKEKKDGNILYSVKTVPSHRTPGIGKLSFPISWFHDIVIYALSLNLLSFFRSSLPSFLHSISLSNLRFYVCLSKLISLLSKTMMLEYQNEWGIRTQVMIRKSPNVIYGNLHIFEW